MQDRYDENWQIARQAAEKKGLLIVEYGWEQHVIIDTEKGLTFRYPRHDAAAAKLEDEVTVLAEIHKQTWPILLPVLREYDGVRAVYDYIPGEVLTEERVASLHQQEFEQIGLALGAFLAQFHQLDFAIVDHKKTKQSTSLLEYYTRRIEGAPASEFYDAAKQSLIKLNVLEGSSFDVVVHGDLHGPNIVVGAATNRLKGVIDLSEMETGNPHLEFRKIFMTFADSLLPAIESYQHHGGQVLSQEQIVLWAYVNEWANACHFAGQPGNATYKRAVSHLKKWGQL